MQGVLLFGTGIRFQRKTDGTKETPLSWRSRSAQHSHLELGSVPDITGPKTRLVGGAGGLVNAVTTIEVELGSVAVHVAETVSDPLGGAAAGGGGGGLRGGGLELKVVSGGGGRGLRGALVEHAVSAELAAL